MGIYPLPFLDVMSESVAHLVNNYQADLKAAGVTPAATEVTRLGGQLLAFLR
jgi:hypothetical protein